MGVYYGDYKETIEFSEKQKDSFAKMKLEAIALAESAAKTRIKVGESQGGQADSKPVSDRFDAYTLCHTIE